MPLPWVYISLFAISSLYLTMIFLNTSVYPLFAKEKGVKYQSLFYLW